MSYQIRPAERTNSKPLIGLYGQSGTGKTYSALLLARGLVGDAGRICMIDTESGRGSLYADVLPGGYDVIDLGAPFAPDAYIEAINDVEAAKYECLIIDSASHEWEGIGGVLDMAGDNEARTGKPGLHCWKDPKLKHNRFMLRLLQSALPVIVCLRAKFKSRQVKNARGKSEIVKDDHASPIQADDFIFEMTAHAEIMQDHSIRLTKCSHPGLQECFEDGKPITIETGRKIAAWAEGGSGNGTAPQRVNAALEEAKAKAGEGTESFRQWWISGTKAARALLKPHMDELKQIAEQADAEYYDLLEDDPFADQPANGDAEPVLGLDEPKDNGFCFHDSNGVVTKPYKSLKEIAEGFTRILDNSPDPLKTKDENVTGLENAADHFGAEGRKTVDGLYAYAQQLAEGAG